MPNWCYTVYHITGDEKEIETLEKRISTLDKIYNTKIYSGCGSLSLEEVVNEFDGDADAIFCDGIIIQMERLGDCDLRIDTETAWHDVPQVFDLIVSRYTTLQYTFLAEEVGNELFINSDTEREYFTEKYYINNEANNETEYAHSDEQLLEYILKQLSVEGVATISELDILLEKYNAQNEGEQIHYYKFNSPEEQVINNQNITDDE